MRTSISGCLLCCAVKLLFLVSFIVIVASAEGEELVTAGTVVVSFEHPQAQTKYLWWKPDPNGAIDGCKGLQHQQHSLTCAAAEARYLNRTLVIPDKFCISGGHNFGKQLLIPMWEMFNSWHLGQCDIMIETNPRFLNVQQNLASYSIHEVQQFAQLTAALVNHPADIIVRSGWGAENMLYHYELCEATKSWDVPLFTLATREQLWKCFDVSDKVKEPADKISALMVNFYALHIRRGDKVAADNFLFNTTHPAALSKCMRANIPKYSSLFISSNEEDPEFFAPLRTEYNIFTWRDFIPLLASHNIVKLQDDLEKCRMNLYACKVQVVNNYHLFQIEKRVGTRSIESYDFTDTSAATPWWAECAKECAPTSCSGSNDTNTVLQQT